MITQKNRIWSLTNNFIELFAGIGLVAAITRLCPINESGTWFLFIAIFGIAGSLRDALIQSALVKHATGKDILGSYGFLKANLRVTIGFELTCSLLIVAISYFFEGGLAHLLRWYPLYAIPNALFRWQIFYLRSQFKIPQIFLMNLTSLLILSGCIMLRYYFNHVVELEFIIMALGTGNFVAMILLSGQVPFRSIAGSTMADDAFSSIRYYGLFAILREGTSAISSRIGLFYSSTLLSLHETSLLGVSQRFAQITLLPNNAFQALLFPALMRTVNEKDHAGARRIFEQSIAQLLSMTIPFALVAALFSPFILGFISGPEYRAAWGILTTYLALATLITPFGAAFGSMVTSYGKPGIATRVVIVNSIVNTVLSYVFMRMFGLPGVALALTITEVIGFVWIASILRKMAGISFMNAFKAIPGIYVMLFRKSVTSISYFITHRQTVKKII